MSNTSGLQENMTAVYLTPEQAKLFIEFQKRFAFVQALDAIGAFDIRSGSLTIHFDAIGAIGSMEKTIHYRP